MIIKVPFGTVLEVILLYMRGQVEGKIVMTHISVVVDCLRVGGGNFYEQGIVDYAKG